MLPSIEPEPLCREATAKSDCGSKERVGGWRRVWYYGVVEFEMDGLSESQQAAVIQLRELTNGGDDEVAIGVLRSVNWDVGRAADLVFGGTGVGQAPPAPNSDTERHAFTVDDSEQGFTYDHQSSSLSTATRPILTILSFPFTLLSSIFRFIFNVLRIPFPSLGRFVGLTFYSPLNRNASRRGHGSGGPDRWIRELEEETGAICIGRLKASKGVSSGRDNDRGEAGPSGPSSSTLSSRAAASGGDGIFEDGRLVLPDFVGGTYEGALKTCQREYRVGCIILVSEEHDDVAEFKRSTLTDQTFVKTLHDNNVLVWGGDVRDREAWSASEKLQATTYPFVAFVALQPRRTVGNSSSSRSTPPSLTVLSRHQGPSTPSRNATGPTSAQTLTAHLTTQVLPRVTPYLAGLRSAQLEIERARQLREEQDRAFQDSARRDTERIQRLMREEEERKREEQRLLEVKQREEKERKRAEEERIKKEEERMEWRRWTRKALRDREAITDGKPLRLAIRLPNGTRTVSQFTSRDTLTTLYATVDAQLVPSHLSPDDDPASPPSPSNPGSSLEETLESLIPSYSASTSTTSTQSYFNFLLASSYPRTELPWSPSTPLSSVPELKGGGQLVVEMVTDSGRSSRASSRANGAGNGGDDSDEYDTEED
ncbi:hypothetical protein CC1G_09900 [Coprinopsis cinerea okayama7|uniref:UBX domain-containing protein n=1 Tax=Coprinopsis cinerea (strain Okayama-7 / 130 / ATCC MYA-4618 / FGSC 9003) TaxID=240176 RepID=A8NMY1_COPC7|nr:hypothetical protein CC1G_09900 [Coprinopsis cinerea okayama7\|eukprot:XP_001835009.1 hypothetical protein CC1G_09900 [Coprinopsis cinerea okayama7\